VQYMRAIIVALVAMGLLAAVPAAQAHNISNGKLSCSGLTFDYSNFPSSPATISEAWSTGQTITANTTGSSGTISTPLPVVPPNGTTVTVTLTSPADAALNVTVSATLSCQATPPPTPPVPTPPTCTPPATLQGGQCVTPPVVPPPHHPKCVPARFDPTLLAPGTIGPSPNAEATIVVNARRATSVALTFPSGLTLTVPGGRHILHVKAGDLRFWSQTVLRGSPYGLHQKVLVVFRYPPRFCTRVLRRAGFVSNLDPPKHSIGTAVHRARRLAGAEVGRAGGALVSRAKSASASWS